MNYGIQKVIFFAVGLTLLCSACNQISTPPQTHLNPISKQTESLKVGDKLLQVEIKKTQAEMELGLSYRKSLAENGGMLFDFSSIHPEGFYPAFWMKGMNFNLDFIWIYKNKVVGVTKDVPAPKVECRLEKPGCKLTQYFPPSSIDRVLEVNAGWTKKNNIAVGDVVELK